MAKRERTIVPHLSLPAKPAKRHKAPRRSRRKIILVGVCELAFLVIALDLGNMAYWYLAPWPIYRMVAFVVIFILWSNVASETARDKTTQALSMFNTMRMQAVRPVEHPYKQAAMVKDESNQDTTGYLVAIKKEHYANTQTRRLHNAVPHEHQYRGFLHHHEATPVR